ncbi:radical SAM protein [Acidobacteriota bacterium]
MEDSYTFSSPQYDTAVLFLTNRCNLRCTYCYASSGEYTVYNMDIETAKAAVDRVLLDVMANKWEEMTLGFHGGGEPTLNWKVLTEIVEYASEITSENGIHLNLSGSFNGYWSPAVRKFMLDRFTDISLSFDGIETVQNAQRPTTGKNGSYQEVLDTIIALDDSPVSYGIRMTVTEENLGFLEESVSFIAENFHPKKIQVEPVFLEGRAKKYNLRINNIQNFVSQFIKAYRAAEERGIDLFYSGAQLDVLTTRFCLAACRALVVTPEGNVTTCFEIFGHTHPLSDSFIVGQLTQDGFQIDQTKLNAVFGRTVNHIDHCRDCFCKWHCAGDCAAKTDFSAENISYPTDRCLINQELIKFFILDRIHKNEGLIWSDGYKIKEGTL